MSRILIIEDEEVIRQALRRLLERNGYQVTEADSVENAVANRPAIADVDLVIADLRLPGAQGVEIVDHLPNVPVLIMTSFASVRSAVDAMKRGAVDYVAKPFSHAELLAVVKRTLDDRPPPKAENDESDSTTVPGMVGACPGVIETFELVKRVAPTDTTVLVTGESGTGKELVARALHRWSLRRDAPMITMNSAAIPDSLVENELFGHEKGSFTGATHAQEGLVQAAHGGTLFLDEIGELSPEVQARLLRVLQDGEVRRVGSAQTKQVNIRMIAATHRDLRRMVDEGTFREDLYFRLHVVEIHLPPLRERGADIELLAANLLERIAGRLKLPAPTLSPAALKAIAAYPWPGNVRELEHAIERALLLCDGPKIDPSHLRLGEAGGITAPTASADPAPALSLEEYFRTFVQTHQTDMTETELAERLGISRKALWERRQRLGIPRPKSGI